MGDVEVLRGRRKVEPKERGLPHDWEAEKTVAGSLMAAHGDGWEDIARVAPPSSFAHVGWSRVMAVIGELHAAGRPCSAVDVLEHFLTSPEGLPQSLTATELLNTAAGAFIPSDVLPRYARRVAEMHTRRGMVIAATAMAEMARSPEVTLADLAQAWDRNGEAVRSYGGGLREWVHVGELAEDVVERARERAEGQAGGAITTGYPRLNRQLGGGWVPGDLVIVGGRPAMGKSAWALSMMCKSARQGVGWGLFSLELMSNIAARRLLAQVAQFPGQSIKTGAFADGSPLDTTAYRRISDAAVELGELPIYVNDRPGQSLAAIRSGVRRLKSLCPRLGGVVVDYVQIMDFSAGARLSRADQIAGTVQGLRNLAKEEGIAVVALSQLNREVDKREGQRPMLADLRDSGGIEAAATVVVFPWRDLRAAQVSGSGKDTPAELIVAKCTDGQTGTVEFKWHGAWQEFAEAEARQEIGWQDI